METVSYHPSKELVLGESPACHLRKIPNHVALIMVGKRFSTKKSIAG